MRYLDSLGVPTIGIGFNLDRSDAHSALVAAGCKDAAAIRAGAMPLTDAQVDALFDYSFAPILSDAEASVEHFERLSPARQFVVCDLVFNLGRAGWMGFAGTRSLLSAATATTNPATAHTLYGEAADHLAASTWFRQVGNRAKRNVAMIRASAWVDANGSGDV